MKYIFVLIVFISFSFALCQQKDSTDLNTGMLYGKNHVFFVTAPDGWVLDNQSAVSQGIHAAFYPKGSSWQHSAVIMYANGYGNDDTTQTIYDFISADSTTFAKRNLSIKILDAPVLTTKLGKESIVKWYFYSQYEAVAYIKESKSVNIIVLSARNEEQFKDSYPDFIRLVASYQFITNQVTYPEN